MIAASNSDRNLSIERATASAKEPLTETLEGSLVAVAVS